MTVSAAPKDATAAAGATAALAEAVAGIGFEALDARTVHRTKSHILDSIGAILAGADQEATDYAVAGLNVFGATGDVPVPGRAERLSMLDAAYIAGTAGHGLEVDDGYRAGSAHPGTVVVPAVLAAAYRVDCTGRDVIRAVVAGYEANCRIAAAGHPHTRMRGFHNTPIAGTFGAAAFWGSLRGFDAHRMAQTFGAAASQCAGLFAFMHGGEIKRLHAGFAARSGLMAGGLGEAGLPTPPAVLECKDGYFFAFAGGDVGTADYAALDILSAGPGSPHAITECYIKPYACCRHIHTPIDAILAMMREDGLTADQVASVHVGTYRVAAAHDLKTWESFTSAQMSIPFVLASVLRHGGLELSHFDRAWRSDPAIAALAETISVSVDAESDAAYPAKRPAVVDVTTRDGRSLSRKMDEPLGAPANPVSDTDLLAKFHSLADPVIGPDHANRVADRVMALETETDLPSLVESLAAPLKKAAE